MSGHTYTHTYTHTHTHTHTHTYTHDNYYNPRCAHAHRGLIITRYTHQRRCLAQNHCNSRQLHAKPSREIYENHGDPLHVYTSNNYYYLAHAQYYPEHAQKCDRHIYIYIYTHRESLVRNHEPCAKALGNNNIINI